MMRQLRTLSVSFALLAALTNAPAFAHPLGNFTINHLARVTAGPHRLHIHYVLDIAEIPTFQITHANGERPWNARDLQSWADAEAAVVENGLDVRDGAAHVVLHNNSARAAFRPGAGGLPILRWAGEFDGVTASAATAHISIDDGVYAGRRIGWKDMVTGAQREPTDDLRRYPSALIGTPQRVNALRFTLLADGTMHDVVKSNDAAPAQTTSSPWFSPNALSDLFVRPDQTPLLVLLTILAAFGLGALHALEPGHGKALLAFTLVGARATTRQAFILAASLTFAHTAGVLLLGVVLFFAAGFVSESIYPWITLLSGAAIAVIGARSLARYVAQRRGLTHVHDREHAHGEHGHTHAHALPGAQPLSFKTAVVAAMSGGIAPCPAAIVVLLAALRLHHLGYGIVLIVIFSLGLAGVLSGLGIAVVRGASWLSRNSGYSSFAAYGPLFTALVISIIGAWTLSQGFIQQGVNAPGPLLAALTLLAIGGYAVANHGHVHSLAHAHTGDVA